MNGDGAEEDTVTDGGGLAFDFELDFVGVEGLEEGMGWWGRRERRRSSSSGGGGGGGGRAGGGGG